MNIKDDNNLSALKMLATFLYEKNYVKESYIDAIQKREIKYPTGLQAAGVNVAIPHTDIEHVNKSVIGIAILENPVKFELLGTDSQTDNIDIIFMLALSGHGVHNKLLETLMSVFQDEDTLKKIKNAVSSTEVKNSLLDFFNKEQN